MRDGVHVLTRSQTKKVSGATLTVLIQIVALLMWAWPGSAQADMDSDKIFDRIAEEVPEFGGAWVEGDSALGEKTVLHIWLTRRDENAQRESQRLLVEKLGRHYAQEDVVVHNADFSWSQLYAWKQRTVDLLTLPGAAWMDIDERMNRIVVGLLDPVDQRPAIDRRLAEWQVPKLAVVTERSEPEQVSGHAAKDGNAGPSPNSDDTSSSWMYIGIGGLIAAAVGVAAFVIRRSRATRAN